MGEVSREQEKSIVADIMGAREPKVSFKVEIDAEQEWWDGERWRPDVRFMCDDETLEGIMQGRICMDCFEVQREAWPEVCHLRVGEWACGFEIRRLQARYVEENFTGTTVFTGPSTSMEDELDRLDEIHERRMFAKRRDAVGSSGTAQGSILIPGQGEHVLRPIRPKKQSEAEAYELPGPNPITREKRWDA